MRKAGLEAQGGHDIVADGRIHRFDVAGEKKGRESGWYVLHLDEPPSGAFGSWRTGEQQTWTAKFTRKLTKAEREVLERKMTEQRKARDEEQKRVWSETAARAAQMWAESEPATPSHPYLVRKAIHPGDVRESEDGRLLIPVRDAAGNLTSLQTIAPDGTKLFLPGGRVQGCYCTLADRAPEPEGTILVCEGFATGASLRAATDLPVVVAFYANNLEPVAKVIREKFPRALLMIAADNDAWTKANPGLTYGQAASAAANALLAFPTFVRTDGKPTDFNDLAQLEGLPRVAQIIEAEISIHKSVGAPLSETAPVAAPESELQLVSNNSATSEQLSVPPAIIDFPHLDRHKPLMTIGNVEALLDALKIQVRYDVIRKDLDIQIPRQSYLVDTAKNDKLTWILSQAALYRLPTQRVPEFVSHIAGQHPYNPVAEWVTSKPWDGTKRLEEFYTTITAAGESDPAVREFKEVLLRRWMVSAIAAAFRPGGVSAHGVLVFRSEQYVGKTAWFKALVPQELELTADGMLLDPRDKDSVFQVVTRWLVELGEVDATFRRSDIAQLKAFITKDKDTLRRPYARAESAFARRTVFFASVNDEEFLADPTGNRRFWTVNCEAINHAHGLDMQQIWAEVLDLYQSGESWYLNREEMRRLNESNREFEVVTVAEELIRERLDWRDSKTLWSRRTAAQIMNEIGVTNANEKTLKQVGKALRDLGAEATRSHGRRLYLAPQVRRVMP
jgi:putative DNA primase/helicase